MNDKLLDGGLFFSGIGSLGSGITTWIDKFQDLPIEPITGFIAFLISTVILGFVRIWKYRNDIKHEQELHEQRIIIQKEEARRKEEAHKEKIKREKTVHDQMLIQEKEKHEAEVALLKAQIAKMQKI